jgi:GNAT superfamily N-acetyltransferase
MLDDMVADYLGNPETEAIWFTALNYGRPVALGFCAPEKLAQGTYNLYALGVNGDLQGKKIGAQMMQYIEECLVAQGHRILIVETSSVPEFEPTRRFYENLGYIHEATIRDFWKPGDDKVIYWKRLN